VEGGDSSDGGGKGHLERDKCPMNGTRFAAIEESLTRGSPKVQCARRQKRVWKGETEVGGLPITLISKTAQ